MARTDPRPASPALILLLAAALLGGCASDSRTPTAPAPDLAAARHASIAAAIDVQERVSDDLLAVPNVVGTATGVDKSGRGVIRVYTLAAGMRLPQTIDGVPIEVEVSGPFNAFAATPAPAKAPPAPPPALNGRYRPVPIGVSVGNANECVPGTIGAMLVRNGERYVLSANHVLARQNQAAVGEAIVQPSRPDASAACDPSPATDVVAQLSEFEPLRFDGTDNVMDAAIALLSGGSTCATPAGFYGTPGAPVAATNGLRIQKVGRTSGLTTGTVTGINGKVVIFYAGGKAKFSGQIMTSKAFGGFGDSGALVVTDDAAHHAVGMVFAGGNNGSAVVNPIAPILARFGATLCAP